MEDGYERYRTEMSETANLAELANTIEHNERLCMIRWQHRTENVPYLK